MWPCSMWPLVCAHSVRCFRECGISQESRPQPMLLFLWGIWQISLCHRSGPVGEPAQREQMGLPCRTKKGVNKLTVQKAHSIDDLEILCFSHFQVIPPESPNLKDRAPESYSCFPQTSPVCIQQNQFCAFPDHFSDAGRIRQGKICLKENEDSWVLNTGMVQWKSLFAQR